MRNVYLLLLFLFSSVSVIGQAVFKGKVVDELSLQPIAQASITVVDDKIFYAEEDGVFSFPSKEPNTKVIVSAVGYLSQAFDLKVGLYNEIQLVKTITNLSEVKLNASVNSAAKFSTLSKIDLLLNPVKSAQELLRMAPGLFVAQHAGGGKAEQIFLRGFDIDHGTDVSVNMDGMPVNMVSHAHGQGYADAHCIIPETINNFDFGAGPYYAGYGNFTTAGYINMSTFENIDNSRIQLEAGRFNTYRTLMMLDLLKKNKHTESAYIAADYNYSDGPTEASQHFNRYNLFAKYNRSISNSSQINASASAFYSKWDASGQIPQRAVESGSISRFGSIDPTEGGSTSRYNFNAFLHTYLNNSLKLENQIYYSKYKFNLYSNFTFFLDDAVNGDGIQQEESRDILGFKSTITQKKYVGNWQIKSSIAVGIRKDLTQNSSLNKQMNRSFISNIKLGDVNETNFFGFFNQQLNYRKWVIDWSLRADHFNHQYTSKLNEPDFAAVQNAALSPKLNIQFNANQLVQLYVKAGKGFHSNDSRVVVTDKNLKTLPSAYGTDLGVILKPDRRLLLNIALWHLYLQQEFVYVGDAGIVEPSGRTERTGVDVVARYQFSTHFFANTNFNYTKARALGEPKGENYIPLAPELTSTGGIFYRRTKGWNAGLSYRYIRHRPANENNSIVAKGYFLLDANVQYSRTKYEYGLVFENMLNSKWNEAQFATESKLQNESDPVEELHFTPGNPFFVKARFAILF